MRRNETEFEEELPSHVDIIKGTQECSQKDNEARHEESLYKPPMTGFDYLSGGTFESDLEAFRKFPEVKTGFENLDAKQGRLAPGLYVLGAVPSLGKTSFCLQMADNIAQAGNFVMYFALEQNRLELTTKSLSRLTARENINTAISSINIRRGEFYNEAQRKAYEKAKEAYQQFSRNITVIELGLSATISTITEFLILIGMSPENFIRRKEYVKSILATTFG